MKPNLMIDFDGVLHSFSKGVYDKTLYDKPVDGAKEFIDSVKDIYRIVIFTSRISTFIGNNVREKMINKIEEWLYKYNIYYDEITCQKLPAVAYIDDMAIEFNRDWSYVRRRLKILDKISRMQIDIDTWDKLEDKVKELTST